MSEENIRFVDLENVQKYLRERYDIEFKESSKFREYIRNLVCNIAFLKLGNFSDNEKCCIHDELIYDALFALNVKLENLNKPGPPDEMV